MRRNVNFEIKLENGFSIKSGNYSVDILIYDYNKSYFENVLTFELLNDYKYGYLEDIEQVLAKPVTALYTLAFQFI